MMRMYGLILFNRLYLHYNEFLISSILINVMLKLLFDIIEKEKGCRRSHRDRESQSYSS